jgi:hypothetical protein
MVTELQFVAIGIFLIWGLVRSLMDGPREEPDRAGHRPSATGEAHLP